MKLNFLRLFLCLIFSSPIYGTTHISLNGSEFSFVTKPRLSEVLSPVALRQDWYWPASALYSLNNRELLDIRDDIIFTLENMRTNTTNNAEKDNAISAFISEIKLWKLAERIPIIIDYDLARINPSFNPLFEEGSYRLNLVKRPSKLFVFGAVFSTEIIKHKPAADVSEYVSNMHLIGLADLDHFYIIQPDGKTMRVAYAYWNKGHQEIMPGSQLYIPFKNQFFSSDNQKLNEKIVFLAANRILP